MLNLRHYYFIYFIFLLILAPFNLSSFDTYYYWDWSRHLDLSYYDGSPMIAYLIKISTLLFGNTLFSLTFVGVAVTALTSWVIYNTARQFLEQKPSFVATSLWLFSPLVTSDLIQQTTYDTPLSLFWALTLYFVIHYLKNHENRTLYFIGISIGLMLLSKYSGIVLIVSLIIFLISTRYRVLFKSYHFYLALLISVICFSPVIIWNYQHEWQSFIYQLTIHQLKEGNYPVIEVIYSFFNTILPALNLMLLPSLLCWFHKVPIKSINSVEEQNEIIVTLCQIICATFLCFYLFTASKAIIRGSWFTPYLITSALLGGYCYQEFRYHKSIRTLLIGYALTSVLIIMNNSYLYHFIPSKKLYYYHLIQQFNAQLKDVPEYVFSSGWFEARMLFFIKNKPIIYTLDCGSLQNQYSIWSADINQKIANRTVQEILFIDLKDRSECLKKYFDRCEQLPTQTKATPKDIYSVFAYKCSNKPISSKVLYK
ncbi:glycosyltransferase family 39 protein [Legionella bononiensis]|uniref:Glycosyltransferase family 39 protein n=1 Tax=Legionella bononiensis TaxID=2793102 RepID=A0ABS1WG29_9GAMM|nr:glycosyltransferase family 39 protein [Legionella bononiensis]MBL7528309.1 glycosyltransferase family 39 protein [Legionella bononiensis]MBL7562783.1 glycosyltransferase family 39 protein [Legionella bononiensis]